MTEPMKAIVRRPSGFSSPEYYEDPAIVHGYCYGKHMDARGHNQPGECTLAIVEVLGSPLVAVPLNWVFPVAKEP